MESRMSHLGEPTILVTGGTGTLARLVVARLREAGREVRVLSRGRRERGQAVEAGTNGIEFVTGDLATGEGIEAAVEGIEIIVHCAGSAKGDQVKAEHLVRAASRAGTRHVVYISVVGDERVPIVGGIDRAMFGYFGSKRAAEQVIADSGLPWTTLHATQFYDLTLWTAQRMGKLPVIPIPAGLPRVYEMAELVRGVPARVRQASAHDSGPAAGQGGSCDPGWREPGARPGRGPPNLGGLLG